jgi:hypothetical protein
MESNEVIRTCLYCDKPIKGRIDKKYCSDYCRNENHNNNNRDASNYMRKVNNVLRKNRRILAKFNPKGKSKIKESTLMEEGYNFAYHTNVYQTQKGGTYYFSYDQGYIKLEDGWLALVIRQEYVK